MRTSLSNDIALDLPSSALNLEAASPGPLVLSPRLHNKDLAPTKAEGRRWGRYSIFALWTNDVHNIANYSFAIGLYALGLGGWQILLSLGIGAALVYFFMNLSGFMGQKTGVPFPVISRISFGIHGAQIPALIRAVIAIAWFGIQTYLASVVFRVLLSAIHQDFPTMTTTPFSACRPWVGRVSSRSGLCNWRSWRTAWKWCAAMKPSPGR